MPCSKVSINKNNKCDKAGCICIPANGKTCICLCENEQGDIMQCDDCKCLDSDECQCKCDDSKCTCIVTKGADCICICRDGRGNFKACEDCSCVEIKDTRCCKKESTTESCGCCSKTPIKETCGGNCKCDKKKDYKLQRRVVTTSKTYKCDKDQCVSLPTDGKSCICVCEDDDGTIVRCDDCKCNNNGKCQCKCDDSNCTCILTKGADCICVCRDGRGSWKACDDCSCAETKTKGCCNKRSTSTVEPTGCCSKAPKKETCGRNCECNEKKDDKVQRRSVTTRKNYKCDIAECVCLPTSGKSCICVCEDDSGAIVRCDDCKCNNNGKCQCKCDDSNCTCILTKGADRICICRDGRGNLKACDDCSCGETKAVSCCNKKSASTVESCGCCTKALKKETCGRNCECNQKKDSKVQRRSVTLNKNYKCDKVECVCLPTDGKSCICVYEDDDGDIVRCDDCKCYKNGSCECKCDDSKCTCIVTNGADCICVCRDRRGNLKPCDDCSCVETTTSGCCDKRPTPAVESCGCCSKTPEKETCGRNCECVDKKKYRVQRRAVATSKNYKCDKPECVCLPTGRKSCICLCEDDNGEIVRCDDCKCYKNGNCECKCDDSNCTCIVTKGAECICVSRDERGNLKACDDCSCVETKTVSCCKKRSTSTIESCGCCSKAPNNETCGRNCECNEKKDGKVQRRAVTTRKNYKCNKAECICLPTDGKSCICVCEDDSGAIVRCDDCKCNNNGKCQCKCDDSNCTCILTKGADCICVCRDGTGNLKACKNCTCVDTKISGCCNKRSTSTVESCGCCSKAPKKETCGRNGAYVEKKNFRVQRRAVTFSKNYKCDKDECVCLPTGGKSCICVCEDDNGEIVRCDDCKCYKNGSCECKCDDSKCTCIVTNGADCICVCRDRRGNLKACDGCSCVETTTSGCCDKRPTPAAESCGCCSKAPEKETCGKNCECVDKKKYRVQRRAVATSKNYKCDKPECVCLPTGGKSCICVCEDDNGEIVRCDDCKCFKNGNCECKCDDSKCTCIVTKGADCICVCRDTRGDLKACDDCSCVETTTAVCGTKRSTFVVESCGCCYKAPKKETSRPYEVDNEPFQCQDCTCCSRNTCNNKSVDYEKQAKNCGQNYKYANNNEEYEPCGCSFKTKDLTFCCKETNQYNNKLDGYNTRASETSQCCDNPKQTYSCCKADRNQEKIVKTRGCICTYKQISYRQIVGDGSVGVTKKVTKSCACYY